MIDPDIEGAVAVLTEHLLGSEPASSDDLRYDLHAILMGWPTRGTYSDTQRARARLAIGLISPEELTALIGPPARG